MNPPNNVGHLSDSIRLVVTEAQALGISVDTVATWSKAVVVHIAGPLTDHARQDFKHRFPCLRYFLTDADPHYAPAEGFFDDQAAVAISFPLRR